MSCVFRLRFAQSLQACQSRGNFCSSFKLRFDYLQRLLGMNRVGCVPLVEWVLDNKWLESLFLFSCEVNLVVHPVKLLIDRQAKPLSVQFCHVVHESQEQFSQGGATHVLLGLLYEFEFQILLVILLLVE